MKLSEEARKIRKEYLRQWKSKNKQKHNEYQRAWRQRNKDKVQEYTVRYWERKVSGLV